MSLAYRDVGAWGGPGRNQDAHWSLKPTTFFMPGVPFSCAFLNGWLVNLEGGLGLGGLIFSRPWPLGTLAGGTNNSEEKPGECSQQL